MPIDGHGPDSPEIFSAATNSNAAAETPPPTQSERTPAPDSHREHLLHAIDSSWRAGGSHLSRSSSGVWYMRLKVPEDIRAAYPHLPKELRRSTKTHHRIHALAISRKMCIDFLIRHKIEEKPMAQPDQQVPASAHRYSFIVTLDGKVQVSFGETPGIEALQQATRCIKALETALAANDSSFSAPHTPPAPKTALATVLSSQEPNLSAVCSNPIMTAAVEVPAMAQAFVPAPYDPHAPHWLSEAIDLWRENGPHIFSETTWRSYYIPSFRILREIIGTERRTRTLEDGSTENVLDIPMREICPRHIHILHECLKQLPPNQGNNTAIVEALVRIKQRERQALPLPSASNVEKKLGHLLPFFKYAKESKWIHPDVLDAMQLARRTAASQLSKANRKKGGKIGYVALAEAELKRLFSHTSLTNDCTKNPWKFWVPLLCLYQGVRVSEASQLYTDDILTIQNTVCVSFIEDVEADLPEAERKRSIRSSDEYRRLKTSSSRRVIPLHPALITLGFLEFVEQIKQRSSKPSAHLFPQLYWDEKNMFGRKPSRFIIGLLKEVNAHVPRRKVAHSLRSNFNQELQRTMIPSDLISRILGHSTGKMKDDHYNETEYGPALPFAEIIPYLEKMDFGVNVSAWEQIMKNS